MSSIEEFVNIVGLPVLGFSILRRAKRNVWVSFLIMAQILCGGVVQGRARSDCVRGVFRDGSDEGRLHANAKPKKSQKKRIHNRTATQRTTSLDTKNWTWWLDRPGASRCAKVVQGRSKTRHVQVNM